MAKEPLHFLQRVVLARADICAATSRLRVSRELSKWSMTDAMFGLKLNVARISRLDQDVDCPHVFHLKDALKLYKSSCIWLKYIRQCFAPLPDRNCSVTEVSSLCLHIK